MCVYSGVIARKVGLVFGFGAAAAAAIILAVPGSAQAVQQPDGTIIPDRQNAAGSCNSGSNVQACLDEAEVALGGTAGAVRAIQNATVDQETYDPSCQLTFKVLSKGGSFYSHAFGWYVAKGGNTPPALNELNVFLTCMDAQTPGTVKVLTVPPGVGKIGFFMASYVGPCGAVAANGTLAAEPSYTFYTERRFNGRNRAGAPLMGVDLNVIRVLTWQSAAQPATFYFGWEDDGQTTDNNFNDLVTQVGGISCSGAGKRCDTGMKGSCAKGTLQCRAGALACLPDQGPIEEKCNAIDDNCDGNIDEGDKLCGPLFICFRGVCVPNCAMGEFPCGAGECEVPPGVCIERACKGVTCPPGQLCRGGNCVGECVGVRCPYGQACRHGGCVDVCSGLKCDPGINCLVQYPEGMDKEPVGVCSTCPCKGCGAGLTCVANSCVPSDCAAVTCPAGMHCQAGRCENNCTGAVCPSGTKCESGNCVVDANAPKGPDGGAPVGGRGGASGAGAPSGGGGGAGAVGADGGPRGAAPDYRLPCGCDIPGGAASYWASALSLASVLAALVRRRRA